ncbi:MAG TPA: DUF4401 domain-containing protein [Campylobacterales bacterium]|nr:DUF4401 domain-containing protein [Sulfurospirillum arcachonense]HIP51564.1 DUF4401 domain-containing protein [Campylobacterales bacterium]
MLKELLSENNLLTKNAKNKKEEEPNSWFILLFQALGGGISAILLLILLGFGLFGFFDEPFALMVVGVIFFGFAYMLLRNEQTNFLEYFAIVFAFMGEGMFLFGIGEAFMPEINVALLLLALFSLFLFFVISSTLHRFLSALVFLGVVTYFAMLWHVQVYFFAFLSILMTWLWLNEYKALKYLNELRTFAYALVLFLLVFANMSSNLILADLSYELLPNQAFSEENYSPFHEYLYYLVGLVSMAMILLKLNIKWNQKLFSAMLVGTFIFYYVQPIGVDVSLAMLILLLAFYGSNRVLMVLGTIGMIQSIFTFYGTFIFDFIFKAKYLLVFGVIVLFLTFLLHLYLGKKQGAVHA